MADNTPSGSGSSSDSNPSSPAPAPAPVPAHASQPAPAVEQAPPSGPSLEKAPPPAQGVEQAPPSVHDIAQKATQRAIEDLNRVDSQGRTPAERAEAAQTRAEDRIDQIAARLVEGANKYVARVAAQSTGNDYAAKSVGTWSDHQMGMSSSDSVGSGTGVEQAPNTQTTTEAGLNTDKGITQAKTNPSAPRPAKEAASGRSPADARRAARSSASAGLGAPKRSGAAKSTLSTRKRKEAGAAQQPRFHPSFPVSNAPQHSGSAKNTVSTPRNRTRRTSQQIALGFKRLLGRG